MSNSDNGGRLVDEIALTVAREYGWPSPAPERRTAIALTPEALEAPSAFAPRLALLRPVRDVIE